MGQSRRIPVYTRLSLSLQIYERAKLHHSILNSGASRSFTAASFRPMPGAAGTGMSTRISIHPVATALNNLDPDNSTAPP
jgi:hypothetical protein